MKKKIFVAVIILLIIGGSIAVTMGLIATKPTPPTKKPTELVINVKQYTVQDDSYSIDVEYPARVTAMDVVKLGAQVGGRIMDGDVPLRTGERFKKGDLLLNIYNEDIEANLMSQKSQFLSTLAKALPDIAVDFPQESQKWISFFDNIDLSKPLPALPEQGSTKEKVYIASKGILSQYYTIEQAEIQLSKYKVYAPFNGVFREIVKSNGSIAAANGDVATIVSTDLLEVSVGLTPTEAHLVNVGKKVSITAYDGTQYQGVIKRISPIVNANTQRVSVYIELHEPSLAIIEGQMVEAAIELNELKDVIRVPREIINKYGQLYRIEDNKLYATEVEVIMDSGEYSYIRGLDKGTKIIYESLIQPKDGTAVRVIEEVEHNSNK